MRYYVHTRVTLLSDLVDILGRFPYFTEFLIGRGTSPLGTLLIPILWLSVLRSVDT